MAPAMRYVNPGARSRHLQWDSARNRSMPPYEPATQEQAVATPFVCSQKAPLLTKLEAEQFPDGRSQQTYVLIG